MGSKTKTSKSNNNRTSGYQGVIGPQKEILAPLGMGGGQSMAMAGNMGLAGATEAQARQIQQGLQNLGQDSSFQAIGQNIGEVGSKYRRPADIESYADRMQKLNRALDLGGNIFTGPDQIERVNLAGTGLKDEQGRTILSMMSPELTATAPTMGQLGGDIGRAITGYNSLQYTDPTSNIPQMVRTQGLADVLAKAAIPGSMALNIIQDLYGKGKNFFFPEEEEEDTFSSAADAIGGAAAMSLGDIRTQKNLAGTTADEIDQFIRTIGQPNVDPFSSGADAVDIGTNIPDRTRFDQVAEPIQELPDFLTGSSGKDKPKVLDLRDIMTGGGGNQDGGDGGSQQQTTPDDPPTDPSEYETLTRRYLEMAGFTQQQIDEIMAAQGYAMGGLIPPESGPMSEGVASLFKNK